MKRALIVLLLLAVAGGLFAQSVVFSGFARSGLLVAIEDDTTFHAYNPDPGNSLRFELNTTATTAAGNAGAAGRIRVNWATANAANSFNGEWAYAWFRPIGDAVTDGFTIYGGKMDNNNWATMGGFDASNDVGSGAIGLLLRYDVSGLSFGAGIYPSQAADASREFDFGSYRFGVKYTSAGVFAAAANIRYNGGESAVTNANAGVDILALSSLGLTKLALDAQINNLGDDFDSIGQFGVGPRVDFKVGDLSGRVRARIWIPALGVEELDFGAEAYGQYPVTSAVTAKLGVGYALHRAMPDTNGNVFGYREWDDLDRNPSVEDESLLIVRPFLTLNIGGGSIDAGYSLSTHVGGEAKTKHAIFATFNVGF